MNRRTVLLRAAAAIAVAPLAPLLPRYATDGTVAVPSLSFASEASSGLYRIGAGKLQYFIPVTEETLEDLAVWGTTFTWDGERVDPRTLVPA